MLKKVSLVGPDVFMCEKGKLYKKASDDNFLPLTNKYTEAEDRFVKKRLNRKEGK